MQLKVHTHDAVVLPPLPIAPCVEWSLIKHIALDNQTRGRTTSDHTPHGKKYGVPLLAIIPVARWVVCASPLPPTPIYEFSIDLMYGVA
jgi:hypothetical protein